MAENYAAFLERKRIVDPSTGLSQVPSLNPMLFEFQRDIVAWALRRGRAAIFADCGMGKTPMQLEWARHIPGDVLILAPLAVSAQTVREGEKFGVPVGYARNDEQIKDRITITNYEMLEHFDIGRFSGVVLDESSILKAYDGKTRTAIIDGFAQTPFRLACTATPSPNDYMELGNHAQFLGAMSYTEMLSMFFVHDGGETQKWRLKGHAESEFWRWLCSWAVMIRKPSDLGYDDGDFKLPEMVMHDVTVKVDKPTTGMLFAIEAETLQERIAARRDTVAERVQHCAAIVIGSLEQNRVKLAEWTAKNQTTKNDTTPSIEKNGLLNPSNISVETQKEEKNICADTMPQTKANGTIARKISKKNATSQGANDTLPIQSLEKNSVPHLGTETLEARETEGLNQSTESRRPITTASSQIKTDAALYAGEILAEIGGATDSTLTTLMTQDKLEGCSAQAAISDSESSKTTQNYSGEQWIIWCGLNDEANRVHRAIPGSVNIQGSDSREVKERAVLDFLDGKTRVLISKVSIIGFGLNLQCCHNMVFLGLSDSYEAFYQAVRRVWRFGQRQTVNVHVICSETEGAVVQNIKRKEREALQMAENMVEHMKDLNSEALHGATIRSKSEYVRDLKEGDGWKLHLADCVDVAAELPDNSIGYSVYSPPFASLYTYSNSDRDMGNCKDDDEFMQAYRFIVQEIYRVTMPGRLTSFHCMNMPTSKVRDGVIGLKDFRGELIRMHIEAGWIYHSEVCIWKDPVTAMQRTKALGLLYKQIKKDSAMSRMGIPDYVVTMRKPGENPERVTHTPDDLPVSEWQKIASPIWMDINPSDTLQFRSAREHNDERHICPLQLEVIRRCLRLWSNPGDVVFSPFAGIGSEGYTALQMGRKFIGAELKKSYWEQAHRNLAQAIKEQGTLFA